jgi:hypothetical protein
MYSGPLGGRKFYSSELDNLYCPPNIMQVIQSRLKKWEGHVAVWGAREMLTEFWWGKLREREHFRELHIYLKIILKWILKYIG